MRPLRRLLSFTALALALALGQFAAAVHALEHAHRDGGSIPAPQKCESHSLFASLGSALGSDASAAAVVATVAIPSAAPPAAAPSLSPRYTFFSRAPPASPA